MFEPIVEVGRFFWALVPKRFQWKPKLNFITVHYLYLISMSIVGSIIFYGASFMPYNDALFFAVGCATQSGLNTLNVNDTLLYQQIVMMLIACVCNPIFINTVVVFVRLYWFEKRFKHLVQEIREQRRSKAKTISRTKSEMKEEPDLHRLELGVNGREIRVLHETTQPDSMSGTGANSDEAETFKEKVGLHPKEESVTPTPEGSNKSSNEPRDGDMTNEMLKKDDANKGESDSPSSEHHLDLNPTLQHRDIMFADEVQTPGNAEETLELARVPDQADVSKHVEFLERQQRNAKGGTTLRIPGPRAFDRGEGPKELDDSEEEGLQRPQTRNTLAPIQSEREREGMNTEGDEELIDDDHPERGGIRFDEQEHPGHRQNTIDRSTTANSRFGLNRIRTGATLRRRHSNSNRTPNISESRGSIGRTFSTLTTAMSRENVDNPMPYLSWQATTGRNSAFLGLTETQREELGGIEYRALKTLAKVLLCYFFGFHFFGLLINTPWIVNREPWKQRVRNNGVNPAWWGIFTSASLFNDLGLTLTPTSMIPFQTATSILFVGSFLIIIGNTGLPVMLRFVIWATSKVVPYGSGVWEELRFLLDHPRRCFTLLFPSKATWWLFWVLVLLNGIDLIFFIILDLNDPVVTHLPPGFRVLNGWFQATSTRTAGFSCVSLYYLHPAIQVSYMIMMYISVFPIAISVRRTNVYEEKSLGIFGGEEETGDGADPSYVGQHLRRQLSFDLWYIFLGYFVICIVEGDRLQNTNDHAFTMFSVLFEIVSAYGTVGLSLGYPGIDESFSAEFRIISKLVVMAMMLRGRHRGLPYALDRAILLPSENLQKKEAEDADRRYKRRGSIFAEGREADRLRRGATWSETDLDESGLPRQHISPVSSPQDAAMKDAAMTAGAGGDPSTESPHMMRRRPSAMSTASGRTKHERSRSLSRVIAGGLSAGPTFSKHD